MKKKENSKDKKKKDKERDREKEEEKEIKQELKYIGLVKANKQSMKTVSMREMNKDEHRLLTKLKKIKYLNKIERLKRSKPPGASEPI